jgi:Eukaryotic cytochrome b561
MTLGVVLFMTNGVVMYAADLSIFGITRDNRSAHRALHGACMFLGALLVVAGYLVAFTEHETNGVSQIARGKPPLNQAHVWIGYITVVAMILLVLVGLYKMLLYARDPTNERHLRITALLSWHGVFGRFAYLLGMLNICLGVAVLFDSKVFIGVSIAVIALIVVLALVENSCGPKQASAQAAGHDGPLLYPRKSNGAING